MKSIHGTVLELPNFSEYKESQFNVHVFTVDILEIAIIIQVVKMSDSLLIYVNDKKQNRFFDLSLAMNDHSNRTIGTKITGDFTDDCTKSIAQRLAKKTDKAVFLSCNLDQDHMLMPLLEKSMHNELLKHPDYF